MTDFDTTPLSKEFVEIGGKKMAYHEIGEKAIPLFSFTATQPRPTCEETLSHM